MFSYPFINICLPVSLSGENVDQRGHCSVRHESLDDDLFCFEGIADPAGFSVKIND